MTSSRVEASCMDVGSSARSHGHALSLPSRHGATHAGFEQGWIDAEFRQQFPCLLPCFFPPGPAPDEPCRFGGGIEDG